MLSKPEWVLWLEQGIARWIPVHPNVISSLKLFLITPLFAASLNSEILQGHRRYIPVILFCLFGVLDYLDGVVARGRGKATVFGGVYDRLTDLPMYVLIAWHSAEVLPRNLLAVKITLDILLALPWVSVRGSIKNRLRMSIGFTTFLVMVLLLTDLPSKFVTADLACALLGINIFVNAIVVLRRLGVLRTRYLADALSAGNLACGGLSMYMAHAGRIDLSIVFLLVGAAFDGLDGAAARRFGSTAWGVYSDDIADAVNYGIAPGVALFLHFRTIDGSTGWIGNFQIEGVILGSLFTIFTLSRLIYFTLAKSVSDPDYFRGVPSTIGGIVVLTSLYLFNDSPALLGLMVGAACILMVSFDTQYRHLGRLVARHQRMLVFLPMGLAGFLVSGLWLDRRVPIALLLVLSLGYGLLPTVRHFQKILREGSTLNI